MDKDRQSAAIGTLQTPPSISPRTAPLDFIFAEHARQRLLCGLLDELAVAAQDEETMAAIMRFLSADLVTHLCDEEDDLFPMLRRRADPADHIEAVLAHLNRQHACARHDAAAIAAGLSRLRGACSSRRPDAGLCLRLRRFSASERRHLMTENAIVLPLARAVFRHGDLERLGRNMAARRGWAAAQGAEAR